MRHAFISLYRQLKSTTFTVRLLMLALLLYGIDVGISVFTNTHNSILSWLLFGGVTGVLLVLALYKFEQYLAHRYVPQAYPEKQKTTAPTSVSQELLKIDNYIQALRNSRDNVFHNVAMTNSDFVVITTMTDENPETYIIPNILPENGVGNPSEAAHNLRLLRQTLGVIREGGMDIKVLQPFKGNTAPENSSLYYQPVINNRTFFSISNAIKFPISLINFN